MSEKPKSFKKIQANIKIYYCIELENGNYILYDKNMRNPIAWGSIAVIDNLLSTLNDNVTVFYYDNHPVFGFRKNNKTKPKQNPNNKNTDYSGKDLVTEWKGFDPSSKSFFYIELDGGKAVLFDEHMGQPLFVNQAFKGYDFKSKVGVLVSRYVPKTSNIYYFKQVNEELRFRLAKRGDKK